MWISPIVLLVINAQLNSTYSKLYEKKYGEQYVATVRTIFFLSTKSSLFMCHDTFSNAIPRDNICNMTAECISEGNMRKEMMSSVLCLAKVPERGTV